MKWSTASHSGHSQEEARKKAEEEARKKAQEQQQLYQTQLAQEREFKERQRFLNKEVYGKNVPDDCYYDQWGRDVR